MANSFWKKINSILESFKKFPLFKLLYRLSWAPTIYHFSLAAFGAFLYCFPSRRTKVIGITGTKGKTTVTELISAIFEAAGKKTALLSSLQIKIGANGEKNLSGNSMPGRFFVQNFLKQAADNRCEYAIIEVTSQGIVLSRHRFIHWVAAILTNLAPEHIESHGSFENYRNAKLSFLKQVAQSGSPVFLNKNDKNYTFFSENLKNKKIHDFSRKIFERVSVQNPKLKGDFYKDNMAVAFEVTRSFGVSEEIILRALSDFKGVEGRLDFIQKDPFVVVVDYAHTPDSLESIYKTMRSELRGGGLGRLICVLGSAGGGRDKWKRPAMGEIAASYCDVVVLTDEDPYEEEPESILNQIVIGFKNAVHPRLKSKNIFKELDRRVAIEKAMSLAKEGDVVVMTGKGSESWIHVRDKKKIPWNEREIVEKILSKKKSPEDYQGDILNTI